MVSSERSSLDLPEYALFLIKIKCLSKINFQAKIKNFRFVLHFFFDILSKLRDFVNSDDRIGKNQIRIYIRLQPVFIQGKDLKFIKKLIFLMKNEKFR